MENQKASSKSVVLNYGLLLGILTVLFSVAMYAMEGINMDPPFWQKAVAYLLSIVIIILGIKKYRELNNDTISFGKALKTGVGIALIGGVITGLYVFVFAKFIEPGLQEMILQTTEENMLQSNPDMPDEAVENALKWTETFTSPFMLLPWTIIAKVLTGLIVSLIGGAILKKEAVH